jgi:hypothetical protein
LTKNKSQLPKITSQYLFPEAHYKTCETFELIANTINNRSNIKENAQAVKEIWDLYLGSQNVDTSEEEELEKNASERVLLENAITRALLIYCIATQIRYEKLTEEDEMEIIMNVPFIKHLVVLKAENYGAQILKENFGLELVDWNEEGIFVAMPDQENEKPN